MPILGKTGKGNKSTGWTGSGSAKFHFNTSIFRQMIVLMGCNIDGGILAKFDADGDYLDEDLIFTFEDFSMLESFAAMNGFITI